MKVSDRRKAARGELGKKSAKGFYKWPNKKSS